MTNTPDSENFVPNVGFKFIMNRTPITSYFLTSCSIPDITLGEVDSITNNFVKLPTPGDQLQFGTFDIDFRVDEDLKNYKEIYDWLIALGAPESFDQRRELNREKTRLSDGSVIITTARGNPNMEVKFTDMYPVSLGSLEFNIEETEINHIVCSASFVYRTFNLTSIQ